MIYMRNLIVGDIHSSFDRLMGVLNQARFNPSADVLYSTGDLFDRGSKPLETLSFLMSLPHFLPVAGNHDLWLYDALRSRNPDEWWTDNNGGWNTWESIIGSPDASLPDRVMKWLADFPVIRILPSHIIVHGGVGGTVNGKQLEEYAGLTIENTWLPQDRYGGISLDSRVEMLCWDREYIYQALGIRDSWKSPVLPLDTGKTIVCGHTPLNNVFHSDGFHLTCIDTGSFVEHGHITLMDLDSGEIWTSGDDIPV